MFVVLAKYEQNPGHESVAWWGDGICSSRALKGMLITKFGMVRHESLTIIRKHLTMSQQSQLQ